MMTFCYVSPGTARSKRSGDMSEYFAVRFDAGFLLCVKTTSSYSTGFIKGGKVNRWG